MLHPRMSDDVGPTCCLCLNLINAINVQDNQPGAVLVSTIPSMILLIDVYTRQNLSLSVFARKASLNTRCKYRERFFHVTGKFTV